MSADDRKRKQQRLDRIKQSPVRGDLVEFFTDMLDAERDRYENEACSEYNRATVNLVKQLIKVFK